ncbi:MAG: hypothetical protein FJ288_14900 [Planctomycetes bacterium]|nr:hypothetical protein [Planctomycetota bacterium]
MRHAICLLAVLAAALAGARLARAQAESHCLPGELPPVLFPTWVLAMPSVESQETAPPLVSSAPRSRSPAAADGQGRPDAVTLAEMAPEPREAIRLAESGKFKEAAAAGSKLLNQARENYRDYTWDYLGNATAWALIQAGDLKGAAQAHLLAATRIDDEAVADYHRAAARMLTQTKRSADELKNAAPAKEELRKGLSDTVASLRHVAASAKKATHPDAYLRHLTDAYAKVRLLMAADPETGGQEKENAFREAVEALAGKVIPSQMAEARKMQDAMHAMAAGSVHSQEYDDWNARVRAMWAKVQALKRLCRMADYLARMKLGGSTGDAGRLFADAHKLLFVPGSNRLVWQEMGRQKLFNGIAHIDIRQRIPWQETYISPMGVRSAGPTQTPDHAFQPVDGQMKGMDGKMTPMTERLKPMTQMQPKYR